MKLGLALAGLFGLLAAAVGIAAITGVFSEEEIKIEARALLVNEDVSIKYAYIKEYYEYDNSFYLFISMNQLFLKIER